MPHVTPRKVVYLYRLAANADGSPYVGRYEDGTPYYNIIAVRRDGDAVNSQRIIARTGSLEKANRLVQALMECTC